MIICWNMANDPPAGVMEVVSAVGILSFPWEFSDARERLKMLEALGALETAHQTIRNGMGSVPEVATCKFWIPRIERSSTSL